jgi:hypothetical protein
MSIFKFNVYFIYLFLAAMLIMSQTGSVLVCLKFQDISVHHYCYYSFKHGPGKLALYFYSYFLLCCKIMSEKWSVLVCLKFQDIRKSCLKFQDIRKSLLLL